MDGTNPLLPTDPALFRRHRAIDPNAATTWEWVLTFAAIATIVAQPFLVGDQPQGAESLNPISMLQAVSGQGDKNKQIVLLCAYLGCGIALVRKEQPRAWLFIGIPCGLLLLWTCSSALWSVNADVTLRRSVALIGTLAIGVYTGLRFEMRRLLILLCIVGVTVMVFSLILMVVAPLQGMDFDGRLRGVASDKNHFASFSALILLSSLALTGMGRGTKAERLLRGAAAVLAISCMLLARSTSVVPVLAAALAALAVGHLLLRASPKTLAFAPLAGVLVVALILIAASNSGAIAEALGKDADISGRTLVWSFSGKLIQLRPVEGYGLGAVWEGDKSPGAVFWAISHLGVPHAHNGFIQLTLELGAVGAILFAAACLTLVTKLIWLVVRVRQPGAPWAFGFLSLYLVANYSETWLWIGNETVVAVFIALIVRTNIDYLTASRARPPRPRVWT